MQTVLKYFISLILIYKFIKKTALPRCAANQVGTGRKLHFQPKNPARAKLAAINNQKWLWHGYGVMQTVQKYSISLKLTCKVRKNKVLLRCTTNQTGTCHYLHSQSKTIDRAKLAAINNKKWLWHGWVVIETVWKCFISLIQPFKIRKKIDLLRCTTNQAGTGHKLNFQPKNPDRAKLAAINNKKGCGTAEV